MEQAGDAMRNLQRVILRKLEAGELPETNGDSPNSGGSLRRQSSAPPDLPRSTVESLTSAQRERRAVIMLEVVQRYIFDKRLDPLADDVLLATVRSYDQLFTHAGIPTERIPEVYAEAMRQHGPYLLKVDDFLRAWATLRPREGQGADTRAMGARGVGCSICRGAGMTIVYDPKSDADIEKECPYHCQVVTAIARAEG